MAKTEILIEDPNLEYDLNEEDVTEYAKQIGIDVKLEKHLMWIAEKGLSASVPEPWLILLDEKGRIFYSNFETGEKSWLHPLDVQYSALVIRERQKSLHSPLSCGYESKLSSLSDAPPLSLSGKNTPSSLKSSSPFGEKKRDLGHFENRRGTKLAPVKLNSLKMPTAQKSSSAMSFMPKGTALSRNIRRANDEPELTRSQISARPQIALPQDDLNESFNSDDGSKYSYEETEDDMERSYDDMNLSEAGSQFSPPHSTVGSPEALDINSLVQLGTKLPPSSKKPHHLQSMKEEQSPSLSLRKSGQPSFLKPLQQQPKKKTTPKAETKKKAGTLGSKYDQYATDEEVDSRIAALNEEQRLRFESIQKEWAAMQEELARDEKLKYDKMVVASNEKLEKDELSLRKENAEKMSKIKDELEKKIIEEKSSAQATLLDVKKENEQKYAEEERELKKNLETLKQTVQAQFEKMEQENAHKISQRKEELEGELKKEIEKITASQKENLKMVQESGAAEIESLTKAHKEKMDKLQLEFLKEEENASDKKKGVEQAEPSQSSTEAQKIEELVKKEQVRLEELQIELNNIQSLIRSEKDTLATLEDKAAAVQTAYEEAQDEVDKIESDLDLLRTEKSTLISELNILKENIKSEKSNLLKERNMDGSTNRKPATLHKGINATYSTVCQAVQVCIESRDASCQIGEIKASSSEKHSQTLDPKVKTLDISCQADLVQLITSNKGNISCNAGDGDSGMKDAGLAKCSGASENVNMDVFVKKVLENAIVGINDKMDERFKAIEEKLGSLGKDSPYKKSDAQSSSFKRVVNSHPHTINQNQLAHTNDPSVNTAHSSQKKCSCERGDASSCNVMQDVKTSIYHLNDILSSSFTPTSRGSAISGYSFPMHHHSSPLEGFYSQFRQLQERQRVAELKHKLQGDSRKRSTNVLNANSMKEFNGRAALGVNQILSSNSSFGAVDDPLIRARNLVLREQARSWKQQQQYLSTSDPQGFIAMERNRNISVSDISPPRTSSALSEQSTFQYQFLKFEPDPETEYNEWMSRLKTLQDKIRSHKLL